MSRDSIHFISLNAQGLRDVSKRQRVLQWVTHQKANVLYLQETHFTSDIKLAVDDEFSEWHCYHAFGAGNSRGVSILINKSLAVDIDHVAIDKYGRYLFLNLTLGSDYMTLLNIYAHNDRQLRNNFFSSLLPLLKEKAYSSILIGGDFNEVLNSSDRIPVPNKLYSSSNLLKMIAELNLNDVWRTKNSLRSQYTWRRKDSSQKSRIDYWLINEDILPTVRSCDIRPAMIQTTDHMAISITLTLNTKRGPGSWKFNNSLLEDITFVNDLNDFIEISSVKLKNSHTDPRLIWELLKIEIKSRTITFSKRKAKQCSLNLKHTELELKNTQEIADSYTNIPPDVADKIKKLAQEVESIYAHKAKGAMIRSRTQIIDENEKCTKYFLGLEKSRQSRKLLQTLQVDGHL